MGLENHHADILTFISYSRANATAPSIVTRHFSNSKTCILLYLLGELLHTVALMTVNGTKEGKLSENLNFCTFFMLQICAV